MSFLEDHGQDLNDPQLAAVTQVNGPVLVLAGAGSGKTRVLTFRIAHLLYDYRVPMHSILAMTFSNKAAREMHDRVKILLNDKSPARLPWISTFHSVCARLLRMHGGRLGFSADFAIYDTSEQLQIIKDAFEKLNLSEKSISYDAAHRKIGDWKNQGRTFNEVESLCVSTFDEECARVYEMYAKEMQIAQAMDFDDLLLFAYRLLKENPDLRLQFQTQWQYVLIDEFQDTNEIQYKLLKELLNENRNICVVGDDDQSIYGWRGAKIENILQFDREFEGAKVVKLEQNYRSTGQILKAAAAVISKNQMRHEKTLWTSAGDGQRIRMVSVGDDRDEARYIITEVKKLMAEGVPANEIAIFYRINSLSRGFEEECLKQRVPYRIIGGFRFYERKEIKDILSYLKILLNPSDIMAFRRTINTPLRGIGKASVEKIEAFALEFNLPIGDWVAQAAQSPVTGKAREGFLAYRDLLNWGRGSIKDSESLVDLVVEVLRRIRYVEALEDERTEESRDRLENIREFMSAVQEFEEAWEMPEAADKEASRLRLKLRDFLERVSLISDVDQLESVQDQVTLMSLHAAKGLEFRICFMAAMEEGLFPTTRSFDDYQRTEEERRLCYVGITRARERLYLTHTERRRTFGSINFAIPSRFLKDLPPEILETVVEDSSFGANSLGGYSEGYSRTKVGAARSAKPAFRRSTQPARETAEWMNEFDYEFDQRPEEDRFLYHKGDRVSHPSFGEGIVQKAEMMGEDECLTIVFAGRGLKKVLAKFVAKR